MSYEIEIMRDLMKRLQSDINELIHDLSKMPEGRLGQLRLGERCYYYQMIGQGKNRVRKGITGNAKLVHLLARKEYLLRVTKRQADAMKRINQTASDITLDFWESALQETSGRFPQIPSEAFLLGDRYEPNAANGVKMFGEGAIHRTQKGIKVRSKSELIIADMLESSGIPFQYEAELPFEDYHFCPDFTVIRPRDGKIIYWEHFGLTHDQEYVKNMDLKLVKYRNMNIKPWDNLMISYDREDGSLEVGVIRALIEGWLR